jgi:Tol biopolymer transport system component
MTHTRSRRRPFNGPFVAVLFALAGCSDSGTTPDVDSAVAPTLVSMEITPQNPKLDVTTAGGQTLQLTVNGSYSDGSTKVVKNAEWSVSDPTIATVRFGQVSASGIGGTTTVSATLDGVSASTTLQMTVKESIDAPGITATDRTQLEGNALRDPAKAPKLVYPPADVMLPFNLAPIAFQWEANGNNLFLLTFAHENLSITMALDDKDCKAPLQKPKVRACQLTIDRAVWTSMLNTGRGSKITVSIRGAVRGASDLYLSDGRSVEISIVPLSGTIYYWGTGKTAEGPENGIYRMGLDAQTAEPFYTRGNSGQNRCAGCHAVSKDGKNMLMTEYDAAFENHMLGINIGSKQPLFPRDTIKGDFFSFSPDGRAFASSQRGALVIRSLKDGSLLEPINVSGKKASHPDYSPDGKTIALVSYNTKLGSIYDDYHFCDGSILLYDTTAKTTKLLVAYQNGVNNYYPAFSPDGQRLVFNRASGDNLLMAEANICSQTTPGKGPDLYAHPQAELFIVAASGGQVQRLDNANGPIKGVSNTWAKWGPSMDGDEVFWLAFSSTRDYGNVLINSTRPDIKGVKKPQIWISAIKRDGTADPSYPAFWLPGQKTDSGNHLPFWAKSIQ